MLSPPKEGDSDIRPLQKSSYKFTLKTNGLTFYSLNVGSSNPNYPAQAVGAIHIGQQPLYEVQMIAEKENSGWVPWDKGLASTKQPAEVKTPRLPTHPVAGAGALPWPGDTASPQGHPDTGGSSRMTEGPRKPAAEPPNWPFKQIPFGQSRTKVLQQFAGAEVTRAPSGSMFDPGKYASIAQDLDGLYTLYGLCCYVKTQFVTTYEVSYKGWEDINKISLYFSSDKAHAEGVLFLVVKHVKDLGHAPWGEVFAGSTPAISRIVGMEPTTTNTRYNDAMGSIASAMVAKWETSAVTVYYAIHDTWNAGGGPVITYIDREGWKRYVSQADEADAMRRNKAGKSIERNF